MASPNRADESPPAIVCLDPEGDIWRRLLSLFLDDSKPSEFILTRASESSAEILALCRRLAPVLIVVEEANLPQLPLAGLAGLIGPAGVQILLFSGKDDFHSLESFFRQGCCGVLSPAVPDSTLLKAIRAVFSGELWLPRKLISQLSREAFLRGGAPKLTRRESDILRMIGLGQTNQEIADQCFISRETVRWHIRSLYNKIGVNDRAGAMREAKFYREDSPGALLMD
jgi:DNA-binding NarL/FixJ family response regulator